jgi:hypothetical protein
MRRGFALLVASFLLVGTMAAAQDHHSTSHDPALPHDGVGHEPMDPVLHALLHGEWLGTMNTPDDSSANVGLKIAMDHAGNSSLRMTGDQSAHLGASDRFTVRGDTLRWTQNVAGQPCRTVANITKATPTSPDILNGVMSCSGREMTFALHKAGQ